ncbi:MAG: hypothetical protein ACW963_04605, partial [Candidatus Sifarchaeia archaeon]
TDEKMAITYRNIDYYIDLNKGKEKSVSGVIEKRDSSEITKKEIERIFEKSLRWLKFSNALGNVISEVTRHLPMAPGFSPKDIRLVYDIDEPKENTVKFTISYENSNKDIEIPDVQNFIGQISKVDSSEFLMNEGMKFLSTKITDIVDILKFLKGILS